MVMSEKEINLYRLTSREEPSDEMLSFIMREAAEDAAMRWKAAEEKYFDQLQDMVRQSVSATTL